MVKKYGGETNKGKERKGEENDACGPTHLSLHRHGNGTPLHSVINFENGNCGDVLARTKYTHTRTNKHTPP